MNKPKICKNCNKDLKLGKFYCSISCQKEYEYKQNINSWLNGDILGYKGKTKELSGYVKKWLKETRGSQCSKCEWDEKHPIDGLSVTEIDHIDGNAENCRPENLRILCPNCHSLTNTFRNRNKNSKRNRK